MNANRLSTPRMELIPATAQTIRWELHDHHALSESFSARVPAEYPPELVRDAIEFFAQKLEADPDRIGWMAYHWVVTDLDKNGRVLIGGGGFTGEPDASGTVEVGYSILPEFYNRGYATEAVRALVDWAYQQPSVSLVIAEAFPDNLPSVRVLTKCGFHAVGPGSEAGTTRFEHPRPTP